MTDLAAYSGGPQFTIGRALSDSFGVILRNFKVMAGIALAVTAAEAVFRYFLVSGVDGVIAGDFILSLISYALVTAPITYMTFQDLRGRQAGLGETMSVGLQKMPRVIGVTVVIAMTIIAPVITVGLIVLYSAWGAFIPVLIAAFVYAVFIFAFWYVAVPVQVVEDVSFLGGFSRASTITRGRRWAILGLVLVFFVLLVILATVVVMTAQLVAIGRPMVAVAFIIPLSAFVTVYGATVPTVTYCLLRLEKEGVGIEDIVKVFD